MIKRDVSRHRHSPLIALTEEDPTRGKLPIKENCSITLQSRSVRRPKATRRRREGWTTVVAGSVKAFRCMRKKKKKKRKDRRGRPAFIAVVRHVRRIRISLDGARHLGLQAIRRVPQAPRLLGSQALRLPGAQAPRSTGWSEPWQFMYSVQSYSAIMITFTQKPSPLGKSFSNSRRPTMSLASGPKIPMPFQLPPFRQASTGRLAREANPNPPS